MSNLVNTPGSQNTYIFGESNASDLQKMFNRKEGPPTIAPRPPKPGYFSNQENLGAAHDIKKGLLSKLNNDDPVKQNSDSDNNSIGYSPVKVSINHHPNKIMPSIIRKTPANIL